MATTKYEGGWQGAGACLSVDPEIFFPISATKASAGQIAKARRVCAGCKVRRECLDFAMRNGEMHGIWGGTTPEERILERRRNAAARRRARPRLELTARAQASRPSPVR